MKNYKKVKMLAKNTPSGSYAAGCPSKDRVFQDHFIICRKNTCSQCERSA